MTTHIAQLGLTTIDLPRSIRRYCEGFSFQDAGARAVWGAGVGHVLGLGGDATGAAWFLVGAQEFLNLEFFHHSVPAQRRLPDGWLPNSLGWVRFGFAIANFDAGLAYLNDDPSLSEIVTVDGLRRVCFRDPEIGVPVELMEDGAALPQSRGADRGGGPRLVYATLSVPDLAGARAFYADALEMPQVASTLHPAETEALWGLPGARRELLLLDGNGIYLELVQYLDPPGQRRTDLRLGDQGIMNIAVGFRDRPSIERVLDRALAAGCTVVAPLADTVPAVAYVTDPMGNSLELICLPAEMDAKFHYAALRQGTR